MGCVANPHTNYMVTCLSDAKIEDVTHGLNGLNRLVDSIEKEPGVIMKGRRLKVWASKVAVSEMLPVPYAGLVRLKLGILMPE